MNPDPSTNGRASSPRRPPARERFPAHIVEMTARRLEAVAKGTKIVLLEALSEGEAGVQELADRAGVTHQNASYHLTSLWREGILTRRSEGSATLYAIEDWSAWWVVEQTARWMQSCQEEQDTPSPHE
jgi:DNA-binding transcriptional ArsR family regulator